MQIQIKKPSKKEQIDIYGRNMKWSERVRSIVGWGIEKSYKNNPTIPKGPITQNGPPGRDSNEASWNT